MNANTENDSTKERASSRVLIVDDDKEAGEALARVLEHQGYHVVLKSDGGSALDFLRVEPAPDFILTDLLLPDLDGREVARQARLLAPTARIALITGWSLEDVPDAAHIEAVFLKPIEVREVITRFLRA